MRPWTRVLVQTFQGWWLTNTNSCSSNCYMFSYDYRIAERYCHIYHLPWNVVDCVWNVMAHAQKPDFVFRRKGLVHLNRQGRRFSRLLAAEVCASAIVMLDTPSSEVVWRVLATHYIRQFLLHFPSRASPCAVTFQLDSISIVIRNTTNQACSAKHQHLQDSRKLSWRNHKWSQRLTWPSYTRQFSFRIHPSWPNL